jgi:hypothetical protein
MLIVDASQDALKAFLSTYMYMNRFLLGRYRFKGNFTKPHEALAGDNKLTDEWPWMTTIQNMEDTITRFPRRQQL